MLLHMVLIRQQFSRIVAINVGALLSLMTTSVLSVKRPDRCHFLFQTGRDERIDATVSERINVIKTTNPIHVSALMTR